MAFQLDMIVEIPYNSSVKYEFDKELNIMRCDRLLKTSMLYPGNYGYIPDTLSGDGDPLDILLVCDYSIYPGTIINVKVIGVLLTTDEKGDDEKLIAVPSKSVDQIKTNLVSPQNKAVLKNTDESEGLRIKSPIIGTAYLAPEPGAKKFVKIGDKIKKGQTVMIVEAMKTMNHVPSTNDGEVKKILVEDGQPVEFGQTLVLLK